MLATPGLQEQRAEMRLEDRATGSSPDILTQAVLATLSYHDLLEMPLTVVELWRFLIRPQGDRRVAPTLQEVAGAVGVLAARGTVRMRKGYVTFPGNEHYIPQRIQRHARAQQKWKRLRRIVFWLQAIPFLRMVAGSGSLAREVVREESDLDVLVIAETGRIWTVRFIVTILLDLFRLRRRPTGPTKDLVCLNHYLALDGLSLPYHSLYTAYEYARLVPLVGEGTLATFQDANRSWMEDYLFRVLPADARHEKSVRPSRVLQGIQRAGEYLLTGWVGTMIERVLGAAQYRRIATGADRTTPGRVVASARQLEFHPHSFEAPLLAAFNARMAALKLEAFGAQEDSGLLPLGHRGPT